MSSSLRVLLVAPARAAADAVARLRARGLVSPALVPSADLLEAALAQGGWDALLVLPGSAIAPDTVARALAAHPELPVFVEAEALPPALPEAVHLAPGGSASLRDHLSPADASSAPADAASPDPEPRAAPLAPDAAPDGFGDAGRLARELPIGLYRSTPDGRLLYGNPALASVLGTDDLEADDLIRVLDYPRDDFMALMAADGVVRNLITTWTRPDGRRVHTRENARAETDDAGRVLYYEGTIEDATDEVEARRASELRARQHEATSHLAEAAASADVGALLDAAALIAHRALAGAWTAVVRRSGERNHLAAWAGPLAAADVADVAAGEAFATLPLTGGVTDLRETPAADEAVAFRALAESTAALAVVLLTHGDRTLGAIVVGYADGTPDTDDLRCAESLAWYLSSELVRHRAERDLADSEATLRYVSEHAGPVLFRQRFDGTYDYLSPSIERLTSVSPNELAARGWDAIAELTEVLAGVPPPSEPDGGDELCVRYTLLRPEGETIVVQCEASPWTAATGEPLGWVGAYHDVTDHVEAADALRGARDEALQAAESARAEALHRSAALAELSHEVRTPLTGVIGFAEVLVDETDGQHREIAASILDGGETMLRTINAVLDHARHEAGGDGPELVPTDLGLAVTAAAERLRALADDKDLALDIVTAPDVTVALDAGSLDRIVTNLVGNAVKYTEAGAVRVSVSSDADHALLSVRDSGSGIPESVRDHLFEPFQAGDLATPNSSGLGLSIVKRLVDFLGGTISVEDRSPGTEVTVRLSRLHPPASPSAQPAPATMTHPLPTPSGDGQTDAAPPAPHEGDGHAAFVARPQPAPSAPPAEGPTGHAAPPFAPPQSVGQAPPPMSPQQPVAAPPAQSAMPQAPPAASPAFGAPSPFAPTQAPMQPAPEPQAPRPAYQAYAPQPQAPQPQAAHPQAPHPQAPHPQAAQPQAPHPSQGHAPSPMPAPPVAQPQDVAAPQAASPAPYAPAPQAPAPAATPPPAAAAATEAGDQKARILVVEDNNDTRMLLDRILRRTYDVTAVGDARSALVAMHNTRFDGLVLDINLGGKETGADILRIARSLDGYQGVFAIALTAYALPGDRERLLEKGFSEYISKPFTRSSLMEALAKGVTVR